MDSAIGDAKVFGKTAVNITYRTSVIWDSIKADVSLEMDRQDRKWGIRDNPLGDWSLILMEEIGEVSQAALQDRSVDAYDEIVQSIAVLVRMAEKVLR